MSDPSSSARTVGARPGEPAAAQILIWRLDPEGTCGVGDYSRGLRRELGWRIVDASLDDRLEHGPQLLQYVPTGWAAERGWAGEVATLLDPASDGVRTLFAHELERSLGLSPLALSRAVADRTAMYVVLQRCARVVVTSESRAEHLRALLDAWRLDRPVAVVGIPSNVHRADPPHAPRPGPPREPTLVTFTTASEPADTCARVAAAIGAALRSTPGLRVVALGRRLTHDDPLRNALARERCERDVLVTGALPADEVERHLEAATVAVSATNTGVSGRRTTVAASLAAGTPLVGTDGPDTDAVHRTCSGIVLACSVERFAPDSIANAIADACALSDPAWRARSLAARSLYLRHHSWDAQRRALAE